MNTINNWYKFKIQEKKVKENKKPTKYNQKWIYLSNLKNVTNKL